MPGGTRAFVCPVTESYSGNLAASNVFRLEEDQSPCTDFHYTGSLILSAICVILHRAPDNSKSYTDVTRYPNKNQAAVGLVGV